MEPSLLLLALSLLAPPASGPLGCKSNQVLPTTYIISLAVRRPSLSLVFIQTHKPLLWLFFSCTMVPLSPFSVRLVGVSWFVWLLLDIWFSLLRESESSISLWNLGVKDSRTFMFCSYPRDLKKYFYLCICVYVWMNVCALHVCGARGSQKRLSDSSGTEFTNGCDPSPGNWTQVFCKDNKFEPAPQL